MIGQEIEKELERRKLPELLSFPDGSEVRSAEDWEKRKAQIREILGREFAGFSPVFPVVTRGEVGVRDENAYGGKAVREKILLSFRTPFNIFSFSFELFVPKGGENRKKPLFVYLGFTQTPADGPGEEVIDNGFALAHISCQEIAPDKNDGFANGLGTFCTRNPYDSWGKLGMWAYGASRAADHLSGHPEIDAGRMAVMGHSRLGKAALLCGAMDERFSLTVANDSGAGGAALFRGKRGERAADLTGNACGHWFCGNFASYAGREEELPFDQHFLLALTAPRYLYVASASEDAWADPLSEFLACAAASPAFEIIGRQRASAAAEATGGQRASAAAEAAGGQRASAAAEAIGRQRASVAAEAVGGQSANPVAENCMTQCDCRGLVLEEAAWKECMPSSKEEGLTLPVKPLHRGHIGYHLRQGTHHLGREDWQHVMEFRRRHGI